ncbi:MAG TPA: chaperone modulator CbpM [Candidatus Sulfomarinibacteraceae bacterium]|nr:chaperone modulator CbpM [Candidatus Sulfomarinibacteraceae bacterium]
MDYQLIIRSDENDRVYSREGAARLARVPLELLELCEQEELIRPRRTSAGTRGLTTAEVRRLARIRRLQEDLELDLGAVEVVLHMRQRMLELLQELDRVEQQMYRREQELHSQIRELRRRLAEDGRWR